MKINIPFAYSLVLICSLVLGSGTTLAQTKTPAIPVATVNIQDAKIVSQKEHVFDISFLLTNREGMQSGVKYGVKLVSNTSNGQALVDEKIYPDTVTLLPNTTVEKQITYTAPDYLNGTYALVLYSGNANGFPFGISYVGDVTLYSDVKGVSIAPESCSLRTVGGANPKEYRLLDGAVSTPDQTVSVTCTATNTLNRSVSLTPSYTTYLQSTYGDTVTANSGPVVPITLASGERKEFSVVLPKPSVPQLYATQFKLVGPDISSNTITAMYSIAGNRATISNAVFDKDRYAKGDTATLAVLWSGYGASTMSVTMTNKFGRSCAAPISQALSRASEKPTTDISIPVTASCVNPKVMIEIKDAKGTVLDSQEFMIDTPLSAAEKQKNIRLGLLLSAGALVIAGIGMYLNRRKKAVITPVDNVQQ
jgi:hypothetical protein